MVASGRILFVLAPSVFRRGYSQSPRRRFAPTQEARRLAQVLLNDLKTARQAFARGAQAGKSPVRKSDNDNLENLDQAFYEFEEAARLVPQNVEYLTAREMTRQHLAGLHLERGND